jgi:hypothetical protein
MFAHQRYFLLYILIWAPQGLRPWRRRGSCQARREQLTVRITSGATQRHPVQPETQVRNSRWWTSSVYQTSTRQTSKALTVRPRANFAPRSLACKPLYGWRPTFSNPSRAAGQALEGTWLGDLQPAPDAERGKKRGRPNKMDSMSKCDYCRKKKQLCSPGCPHRMDPVQDEGAIAEAAGTSSSAVVRTAAEVYSIDGQAYSYDN